MCTSCGLGWKQLCKLKVFSTLKIQLWYWQPKIINLKPIYQLLSFSGHFAQFFTLLFAFCWNISQFSNVIAPRRWGTGEKLRRVIFPAFWSTTVNYTNTLSITINLHFFAFSILVFFLHFWISKRETLFQSLSLFRQQIVI